MAKFELARISNRVRFILAVIAGEVVISNRRRADIEAQLESDGYDRMPNTRKVGGLGMCMTGGLRVYGSHSVIGQHPTPIHDVIAPYLLCNFQDCDCCWSKPCKL